MKSIIAITLISTAGMLYAMNYAFGLPDVHMSYDSGACVEVINYSDTNWSCENLPSKFHHVWVE